MGWHAVSTQLLIESSRVDGVAQAWLVDDAAGGGKLDGLSWYNKLEEAGRKRGSRGLKYKYENSGSGRFWRSG